MQETFSRWIELKKNVSNKPMPFEYIFILIKKWLTLKVKTNQNKSYLFIHLKIANILIS